MNAFAAKILAVVTVLSMLCASNRTYADKQSVGWSVIKTCGKELSVPPLKGHIWAIDQFNDPIIAADSIAAYTSTDSSGTAIKATNPIGASNFLVEGGSDNEFLYLSGSSTNVNVVKQTGQFVRFNVDESQLTWYAIYPNSTDSGHYSVLALDKMNNVFLLDVYISDHINMRTVIKLPIVIQEIAAGMGYISISPDSKYVSYGNTTVDLTIFSVQDQKVVADFKTPQDAEHSFIIWSAKPGVVAYAYAGGFSRDWKFFAIGNDGTTQELLDLKPLVDNGGFSQSGITPYEQNNQIVIEMIDEQLLSHIYILDLSKDQIIDTCLSAYAPRISWIDNDHIFVVAQAQAGDDGMTYSLIVSTQTSDYYKITYDPILLPVGWVTDSSLSTPTPDGSPIPVQLGD